MAEIIDAIGMACPLPVVMAKKAIKALGGAGTVRIAVDNKVATENLAKLANSLGCEIAVNKISEERYEVAIAQGEGAVAEVPAAAQDETVVCITSDVMGHGDDELGKNLLKSFLYALTESETVPRKIIFYNGGVKMSTEGSPCIDDLKKLEAKGTEILSCGACLNHFGLTEKLLVGEVSNMYVILESMVAASKLIKP